jgi:hypothetical protein
MMIWDVCVRIRIFDFLIDFFEISTFDNPLPTGTESMTMHDLINSIGSDTDADVAYAYSQSREK